MLNILVHCPDAEECEEMVGWGRRKMVYWFKHANYFCSAKLLRPMSPGHRG